MVLIVCPVLRKLGLLFAALALFSIAGGHWTVLQSVAWAEMLRDYTQRTGSVALAFEQTFDGDHPCELCLQIDASKAKEQKEKPATSGAKDDAKVKATVTDTVSLPPITPAKLVARMPDPASFGANRTEQPPTPPPRCGTVAA